MTDSDLDIERNRTRGLRETTKQIREEMGELAAQLEKERAKSADLQLKNLILQQEVRNLNKACARNRRLAKRRYDVLHSFKRELTYMSTQRWGR